MVEREKSASYSSLTVNTLLSLVILSQIFKYLAPYENIRIEYLLSIGIVSFFFLNFSRKSQIFTSVRFNGSASDFYLHLSQLHTSRLTVDGAFRGVSLKLEF